MHVWLDHNSEKEGLSANTLRISDADADDQHHHHHQSLE
jgi:hypothetical protein